MQLVTRSTRRLNLVDEVERYAAGTARLLPEITDLEDEAGRLRHGVRGRVAVRSTIGLGRAHIAPVLGQFQRRHPGVEIDPELSHLPPHIAGTPFDFAIRVGRRGIPACAPGASPGPGAAAVHSGRVHRPPRNGSDYAIWRFGTDGDEAAVKVPGAMISNDGGIATHWCLAGHGLLTRSRWKVAPMPRCGELIQVSLTFPLRTRRSTRFTLPRIRFRAGRGWLSAVSPGNSRAVSAAVRRIPEISAAGTGRPDGRLPR
ncbi:hypothetical protein [Amycolatopsis rubida]|uniref:DNA-binding transcriptional regulator, LysR family n=1 Tax=Amycolatopsis rubida TaxID=112413 RepID=A0A1I5RMW8_9PSEU|nr:hypothetical protein [Amycolatopsis rubida]SFP59717.1 DNA-binding transcriptional regulator, LysR family [Amycolatopsis rubida]